MSDYYKKSIEIPSFDECMELVKKEFFYVIENEMFGEKIYTFTYRYIGRDFPFADRTSRNLRSIVFDGNKKLLALPFWKFFNVDENEYFKLSNINDWKIKRVFDKVDGSLIYFLKINGNFVWKTQRSFDNEQTRIVAQILDKKPELKAWIERKVDAGYTPMFELISPRNMVCIRYNTEELVFLCLRDNDSGEILFDIEKSFAPPCKVRDTFEFNSLDEVLNKAKEAVTDDALYEGFVIEFDNGELVKIKTPRYIELSSMKNNVVNARYVAEKFLSGEIYDIKLNFVNDTFIIKFIEDICELVDKEFYGTLKISEKFYAENKELIRKDYAIKCQADSEQFELPKLFFALSMQFYKEGGEFDLTKCKESYIHSKKWSEIEFSGVSDT